MLAKWCCFMRKPKQSDASSDAFSSSSASEVAESYEYLSDDESDRVSPSLSRVERIPGEYRETPMITPSGQQTTVVALAKLNYSMSADETCQYLKAHGVETIFGMHIEKSAVEAANRHQIKYIPLRVRDFSPPGIEIYDAVYDEFLKQAQQGRKIAIHCWGGMGRTGTVLVALKLREMAMHDSFYSNDDSLCCTVRPADSPCTVNVASALAYIRSIRGSEHVIEDPSQVQSLVEYERVLKDRAFEQANAWSF